MTTPIFKRSNKLEALDYNDIMSFTALLKNSITLKNFDNDSQALASLAVRIAHETPLSENNSPSDDEDPASKLSDLKRSVKIELLDMKRSFIPDNQTILEIRELFDDYMSQLKIDYEVYKLIGSSVPFIARRFFTSEKFMNFPKDDSGCINIVDYLSFLSHSCLLESTIVDLAEYSESDNGFITEFELERFIFEAIPSLAPLKGMHQTMFPYYTHTAVRRFLFFLDPLKTRRVHLRKLVQSPVMREFLELKTNPTVSPSNWFSFSSVRDVYTQYLELDVGKKGMLSKADLLKYGGRPKGSIQLTPAVISRIFEENISYQPAEMDYKTFLDLILALSNPRTKQSLQYFFRLLDFEKTGKLTPSAIAYFYSDVSKCLRSNGYDAPSLPDVTAEIFDMVSAQDLRGILLEELWVSGQGFTVTSMLSDVSAFWRYDNREALMGSEESDDQHGDDSAGHAEERHGSTSHAGGNSPPHDYDYDADFY